MSTSAAIELRVGERCRIHSLAGRADLNTKTAKLQKWDEAAGRWEVKVAGSQEEVRIKPANLAPIRVPAQASVSLPKATAEGEDEDSGVYVNATIGGKQVALDPKELKRRFHEVVARYNLMEGPKSDAIADFLTNGESSSVSSLQFAERFGTSEEDASTFLAWINVGIAFKEQYMDPNQEQADSMGQEAARARREAAGVV